MTDDLATWLLEQIAEDELRANAAKVSVTERGLRAAPPWIAAGSLLLALQSDGSHDEIACTANYYLDDALEHAARWDPDRVLAECDAKRRIIAEHPLFDTDVEPCCRMCGEGTFDGSLQGDWPCLTLKLLALPFADRPGYRAEWRP